MTVRKGLLVLFVGIVATLIVTRGFEKLLLAMSILSKTRQAIIGESAHSISYVLTRDNWTAFSLPAGHGRVRFISNASCARSERIRPGQEIVYSVRYRITDQRGGIWRDQPYYFRSKVTRGLHDATGPIGDRLFFIESEYVPCDGRVVLLDLADLDDRPKTVFLKVTESDEEVADVVGRVYYERLVTETQQMFRWERMSRAEKSRLTRWNVYTPDLLTDEEKLQYSKREWVAVAPGGVVGRDYRVRILYRRRERSPQRAEGEGFAAGLRVGAGRRGTIPVPEGEHLATMTIARSRESRVHEGPASIGIGWYGRYPGESREFCVKIRDGEIGLSRWIDGGLLEVDAGDAIRVRAFLGEDRAELFPEAWFVRGYICSPGEPVEFEVGHVGDLATPWRVDLRAFREEEGAGWSDAGISARYELLGDSDKILGEGTLSGTTEESLYDELLGGAARAVLSDAVTNYFLLPSQCRQIRVYATARPLLVSMFNRVSFLAKVVRVPEDYFPYSRSRSRARDWYAVRPKGHLRLMREGSSRVVVVQHRPPRAAVDVSRGDYRWEGFRPVGDWVGRSLLVRREIVGLRKKRLGSIAYSEIPIGREVLVDIIGTGTGDKIHPKLIYTKEDAGHGYLRIDIDNVAYLDLRSREAGGQVLLNPVAVGQHVLRIWASEGTRVYLSNIANEVGDRYLRRSAVRVDGRPLKFRYAKESPGEEVVVGRIYLDGAAEGRCSVCVRLEGRKERGIGPHEDWTFQERLYDIRPGEVGHVVAVGGRWEAIRYGELFAFPVRGDVPDGVYEIEMQFQEEVSGYVTLSRIARGMSDDYRIFRR